MPASEIPPETRLQLINVLCQAAWSDLDVPGAERDAILDLCARFDLREAERARVETWLSSPPEDEDDVDPTTIPPAQREALLDECARLIGADGRVTVGEIEMMGTLHELLFPERDAGQDDCG